MNCLESQCHGHTWESDCVLSTIQVDDFPEGPRLETLWSEKVQEAITDWIIVRPYRPVKSTIVFTFLVTRSSTFF